MKQELINEFKEGEWMACPICGFESCHIYKKGKDKGWHRCFECNIRFKKPMIKNHLR